MIPPKVRVKKILYTTDLSDSARHAFAYAVSLANLYGASLAILHVMSEIPGIDARIVEHIGADQWEQIKQRNIQEARGALIAKKRDNVPIREVLEQFSETAKAAGSEKRAAAADEILVKSGNPVDQILAQAEKRNCDLIVMGSYGHGILEEAVMGSTARRVLRKAKVPVLVVPLPEVD